MQLSGSARSMGWAVQHNTGTAIACFEESVFLGWKRLVDGVVGMLWKLGRFSHALASFLISLPFHSFLLLTN